MKEVLDMYKYYTEEMHAMHQDIQEHIDICHKEPEIHAAYT